MTTNNLKAFFCPLTQVNIPEKFEQEYNDEYFDKPEIESDDAESGKELSIKLVEAMSDPWDPNPNLTLADLITNLDSHNQRHKDQLLETDLQHHFIHNFKNDTKYLLLSTNRILKQKKHMFYFPMDFGELTIDGLIDTGALTSDISEADLNKIKLLSITIKKTWR